jgi:hypothetical protein
VNSIKNKRSLILISTFGILAIMLILPSIRAFSGTVRPELITNTHGHQYGTLPDIQYEDQDYVRWLGANYAPFQFRIDTKIDFPPKSDVGGGNEVEIKLWFSGGAPVYIYVYYTDSSRDTHSQYSGGWRTVSWDLDDNKVVDYVRLWNHEWWYSGDVRVDYVIVIY